MTSISITNWLVRGPSTCVYRMAARSFRDRQAFRIITRTGAVDVEDTTSLRLE